MTYVVIGLAIIILATELYNAEAQDIPDYFAPVSNVTISGLYNNLTNWYYGNSTTIPTATFTATDDVSGVRYIVVQDSPFSDARCKSAECYLLPGDSIPLKRQSSYIKGLVEFRYFAQDNAGHQEEPKSVQVYIDMVPPELTVMKISTDTIASIPVGSGCRDINHIKQCILINANTTENINFQLLGSDRISGFNSTLYRIATLLTSDVEWLKVQHDIPQVLTLHMNKTGIHKLQLKVLDNAGNESPIKEFWIRILQPSKIKPEPEPIPTEPAPAQNQTAVVVIETEPTPSPSSNSTITTSIEPPFKIHYIAMFHESIIILQVENTLEATQPFTVFILAKDNAGYTIFLTTSTFSIDAKKSGSIRLMLEDISSASSIQAYIWHDLNPLALPQRLR